MMGWFEDLNKILKNLTALTKLGTVFSSIFNFLNLLTYHQTDYFLLTILLIFYVELLIF